MRVYGSIQTCFWENAEAQQLSDQGKLLATYLFTGPHTNMMGCFRLPAGYIKADLCWEDQKVKGAFQELSEIDFLTRDEASAWLIIHEFLKWNPIQNPKQGIGIQKLFDGVPLKATVLKPLIQGLLTHGKYFDKGFVNRLQTMSDNLGDHIDTLVEKHAADKEQNKDQDQDQNQDQNQEKIYMSGKPDVVIFPDRLIKNTNQQQSLASQAMDVLQFLNEKTGRVYRPVEANIKLIIARLKSGATVMDCRQVIAKKTREWKGNEKMEEYLRPATLFNAIKFEQYVGELVEPDNEEDANERLS